MAVQAEESFMQHVVRHWQGSLSDADSSAAMQMDPEASAIAGQASQLDGSNPTGMRAQTQELADTGD